MGLGHSNRLWQFLFQSYAEYFGMVLYLQRRYSDHQQQACDTGDSCVTNPVMAHSPQHQESLLHTSPASFLLKKCNSDKSYPDANNDWLLCFFFSFLNQTGQWQTPLTLPSSWWMQQMLLEASETDSHFVDRNVPKVLSAAPAPEPLHNLLILR